VLRQAPAREVKAPSLPEEVFKRATVVGTFNDWTPGRHQLVARRNGTRSVSVILPPGEHRFRYLATDGLWFDDHNADAVDENAGVISL
jgi:Glycogen recognition site of AMP-activated protein kinase